MQTHLSHSPLPQKLEELREYIRREIKKELKIKEGATLRKVDGISYKSTAFFLFFICRITHSFKAIRHQCDQIPLFKVLTDEKIFYIFKEYLSIEEVLITMSLKSIL